MLWAAGVTSWRTTRDGGRPRGVFCGIGVCFDCLVTVNGRPPSSGVLTAGPPSSGASGYVRCSTSAAAVTAASARRAHT
ncbi:2Fe-2S iron-sulfur cluster-binding protein [Streptomyces griseoincarnatus]